MPKRKTVISAIIFTIICIFSISHIASALELVQEESINLGDQDRVYGSMEGNFLVYGRPNIKIYNERLKQVWSKQLKNNTKPVMSPNGDYFGLVLYNDHSPTSLQTLRFSFYDSRGNLEWKLDKLPATTFEMADNGYIFGIEGVPGISPTRIHLYDKYSDRLSVIPADKYHGLKASPDGLKLVVDRSDDLAVYDSLGNQLAILPAAQEYIIDRDNRYIGLFSNGIFRLFQDEKEVQRFEISEREIVDLAIHVEAGLLVVMSEKRTEIYDIVTGRLKLNVQVKDLKESFTSLDISPDGRFVACGADINAGSTVSKAKRHVDGFVYIIPTSGDPMLKRKITYKSWSVGLPKVQFSKAGASVFVQTGDSLTKYRLK
ncbi:MAG: hypothetical protein R3F48_07845 [Candidatus Zixiibacteriota bacterium]